jgi:hypothetical protein
MSSTKTELSKAEPWDNPIFRDATHNTINTEPCGGWFGLFDILGRSLRTVVAFYMCLLNPFTFFSFVIYTFRFNMLWYNALPGFLMSCLLPFLPLLIFVYEVFKLVASKIFTVKSFDDGNVFFVPPPSVVGTIFWAYYKNFSHYVGVYMVCGAHKQAVKHTWYDHITDKDFWRSLLRRNDVQVPLEIGRWSENKMTWKDKLVPKTDIVCKIPDSYLGIGDQYYNYGEHFETTEDLEKLCQKDFKDKECLVLEFVRPRTGMEIHQFDIVTMKTNDGVKVVTVLYWGECTGPTSHTTEAGYLVDVESETLIGKCAWYSPYFATMRPKQVGVKVTGIKEAVKACVRAHEDMNLDWMPMVGWDCVLTNKDAVFFEGNFAAQRLPRRIFLSWDLFFDFWKQSRNMFAWK